MPIVAACQFDMPVPRPSGEMKRNGRANVKRARYPREELADGKALFLGEGDDGSLDAIECIR